MLPCAQAPLGEIGFYIIQIWVTRQANLGRSLHLPKPQFFPLKYEIHETYVSGLVWGLNKIKYIKWLVHSRHSRNINSSLLLGMSLSASQFQNPVILTQLTEKVTSGDIRYQRGFEEKQHIRHYWLTQLMTLANEMKRYGERRCDMVLGLIRVGVLLPWSFWNVKIGNGVTQCPPLLPGPSCHTAAAGESLAWRECQSQQLSLCPGSPFGPAAEKDLGHGHSLDRRVQLEVYNSSLRRFTSKS